MPQMSPTWWTTLFTMFIMAYIMFMIMMYFNFPVKLSKVEESNKKIKQSPWKW